MSRIVFLVEESSMKQFLDGLLPRIVPGLSFLCVPHDGKSDLEKSVPRKLKAWREPGVRFVVLRDNDGGECKKLKERLRGLCQRAGRPDSLVRIPCQELEAWYLGDLRGLSQEYSDPSLLKLAGKARFRDPDTVVGPSGALEELVPEFQKVSGARRMALRVDIDGNASHSFRVFVDAVRRLSPRIQQGAVEEE